MLTFKITRRMLRQSRTYTNNAAAALFFLYTFFFVFLLLYVWRSRCCVVYVYVCSYVPLPSADAAVNPIQMNLLCFFCSSLAWQLIDVGCSWVIFLFTSLFSLNLRWVGTIFCTITNSHNSFFSFFALGLGYSSSFFFAASNFTNTPGTDWWFTLPFLGERASKQAPTSSNRLNFCFPYTITTEQLHTYSPTKKTADQCCRLQWAISRVTLSLSPTHTRTPLALQRESRPA